MRLSRAKVIRYPHLNYDRLENLLAEKRKEHGQVFIVTESVFSMDGDTVDLKRLAQLKERYRAVLYVDEAHAVGLRGSKGLGLAEEEGVRQEIDLLVGTFGKAWAGQGAFVLCSSLIREYLINTARSFIFTTGLPPVSLSWLFFVLRRIPAMDRERHHVQQLADNLRKGLQEHGLKTRGTTNIVPVLIGDADQAVRVAEELRQHGFWVNAIRPPTVPAGTSRLRLSLPAAMQVEDLASLPGLIAGILGEENCGEAG
jgi:8-amino-7-oxononanoate synthase